MSHFIQLQNRRLRLAVLEGETILECALRHDVRLPSSCRNGTCRSCLCRMTQGQVAYRVEWPGLSVDEMRDGDILPCVAIPLSDVVLLDE